MRAKQSLVFRPISRPVSAIKARYDVVVIGSGYGGGIAASRMARAGKSVCVLERGREILPDPKHGYPNTLAKIRQESQISTKDAHFGDPTALMDLRLGDDVSVLVGCGLGGTSLINANVALEVQRAVLTHPSWPQPFRHDPTLLDPYYARAQTWLGSTPYPAPDAHTLSHGHPDQGQTAHDAGTSSRYPTLNKAAALQASAAAMQQPFRYPPLNVTFRDGPNHVGVHQAACVLCGDCVSGCNYGAKNTTLMNYLPDAHRHGAEIFTYASVQYLAQEGDGWKVYITSLEPRANHASMTVSAEVVIVAAGTLGSTEILLRSRAHGVPMSDQIGQHFSCNGDVLAFGYDNDWAKDGDTRRAIYGVGAGERPLKPSQKPGPCIAGVIDMRRADGSGLVIEEGVIPGAFASILPPFFFFMDATQGNVFAYADAQLRLEDAEQLGNLIQNHPEQLGDASYEGPVGRTQTYLVMSHDEANGTLVLDSATDRLRVEWPGAGRAAVYTRDDQVLRQANQAIRGTYIPNPLWSEPLGKRVVTVHPIGGCAMADSGDKGVVNHKCQVFRGATTEVYPHLYVCDGAVMPTSLGVNPLLTIAAVAERACELLAHDRGWNINYDVQQGTADVVHTSGASGTSAGTTELTEWGESCFFHDLKKYLKEILLQDHDDIQSALDRRVAALTQEVQHNLAPDALERLRHELQDNLRHDFVQQTETTIDQLVAYLQEAYDRHNEGAKQRGEALFMALLQDFPSGFSPRLSFAERMTGFFLDFAQHALPHLPTDTDCIVDPFEIARKYGEAEGQSMEAEFTVTPVNLHRLISDPEHVVPITGTVRCQALSGSTTPMPVQHGCLRLLPSDPQHVETWNMVYTMFLCGQNDTLYYVEGYKIIHQRPGSSVWSDLTTLYVTVYVCPQDDQGEAPPAATHRRMVGRGIITLGLDDLVRQGSTLKLHRGVILSALRKKLRKWCLWKWWDVQAVRAYFHQVEQQVNLLFAATFAGFFGQVLFRAYGGLLADLADFPRQDNLLRPHRGIKAPKPEIHRISTTDQVELQLTRYAGKHPVLLAPGFGVRASSFATDTTNENLVEYLLKHDYDVWLFDYRASPTLTSSVPPFTIDDIAQYDWPAAVQYVCGVTRTPQLQAIAHCVGSMSFLMALLLNRDEFRQHIRSAICSQLTLHPVTNWLNHLKADINLIGILEKGFGLTDFDLNSASPDTPGYMTAKRIDTALWNVPVPAGEACTNPTCHRISSVYGPVYAHRQLNAMTHTALSDMFGPVHLKPFEQLSRIVKQGVVVDHKGRNIYLTVENARHLRLPLTFMAGGRNQLFYPETSELTLAWLKHVNPGDKAYYTRHVFAEYAHMDVFIGKSADREVFPFLIKTLHDTRM